MPPGLPALPVPPGVRAVPVPSSRVVLPVLWRGVVSDGCPGSDVRVTGLHNGSSVTSSPVRGG